MWLQKPNPDKTHTTLRAAVALGAAWALCACSASYVEQDAASVLLVIETIATGQPLLSDVRGENGVIVNCQTTVTVSSRPKNQSVGATLGTSEDVRVQRYSISYRRSDGRGTQGLDVPYTINGVLSALVPVGEDTEVTLDLVRHNAKLEPPLSNITGLQIVTMFADITVSGQTVSGDTVSASGSTQVTFADFADGTSTCESAS